MTTEPEKPRTAKEQYDHWKGKLVFAVVAMLTVCCFAIPSEQERSQWIIALFTVVMTWVMVDQNRKFDQQNAAMVAQNDAIKKQIDQVEEQQRAWLATSATTIKELVTGLREGVNSVDISDWGIVVRNTGPTPGIITHSCVWPVAKPLGDACDTDVAYSENRARQSPERRTVIAPGSDIIFRLSDGGGTTSWSDEFIQGIRKAARPESGYLIGAFVYKDVFGRQHKTTCCFKFNPATQQLDSNYQDGEMT
jgi:hypothetical protein